MRSKTRGVRQSHKKGTWADDDDDEERKGCAVAVMPSTCLTGSAGHVMVPCTFVLHVGNYCMYIPTILEADLITCPDESPWSCRLANCGFCKAEVRVAGPLQDSDKIDYQIAKFVEQRRLS